MEKCSFVSLGTDDSAVVKEFFRKVNEISEGNTDAAKNYINRSQGTNDVAAVKEFLHKLKEISEDKMNVASVYAIKNYIDMLYSSPDLSGYDEEIPYDDRDNYLKEQRNRAKEFYTSIFKKHENVKNFACKMIDKAQDCHKLGRSYFLGVNRLEGKGRIVLSVIWGIPADSDSIEIAKRHQSDSHDWGKSIESDRGKLEEMYKSDPYKMLEDFSIQLDVVKGVYYSIIHETGHALHFFKGICDLMSKDENRKCLNNNAESVSVFFEVLASDTLAKRHRLRSMLKDLRGYVWKYYSDLVWDHFEPHKKGYNDSEKRNFRPLDCLLNDKYNASLYKAFELSDRVSAGEITVLEGMEEAMYGEIPNLTPEQLSELIDRLAS